MTDRKRALIATLVYTIRNKKFFLGHSVGVKRYPDGTPSYEFVGKVTENAIYLRDDKYNFIEQAEYYQNPYGVKIKFMGSKGTYYLKLFLPEGYDFKGEDDDYFRFEGRYYPNDDIVEIRDYSQDKDKYAYKIDW